MLHVIAPSRGVRTNGKEEQFHQLTRRPFPLKAHDDAEQSEFQFTLNEDRA
jgi:hypothetical protein